VDSRIGARSRHGKAPPPTIAQRLAAAQRLATIGADVMVMAAVAAEERPMTDYWLSKMFFDLQHDPQLAAAFRADMAAVLDRYELKPAVRKAVLEDDVGALAPLVNAYLLRFYFQIRGMPEAEFIARLNALDRRKERAHG
jgi:hypothetical protein